MSHNDEADRVIDQVAVHRLMDILRSHPEVFTRDADSFVHALVDIYESTNRIYKILLDSIIEEDDINSEELQDRLWEIREEFRHIEYHIHDGGLLDG